MNLHQTMQADHGVRWRWGERRREQGDDEGRGKREEGAEEGGKDMHATVANTEPIRKRCCW